MSLRKKVQRTLRAETLESRQLLHGGALAGGGESLTAEERATEVVSRYDTNENLELSQDEMSERIWNRISEADGDESASISVVELTAHFEAAEAERAENGRDENGCGERGGADRSQSNRGGQRVSIEERIDALFAENDTNSDGLITDADEVSEELFARLADADVDGDGVSQEDLVARHESRLQARFDARFDSLDSNDDGGITADEVSERRWETISAADGEDGDGVVTAEELQTHLDAQRAERQAEQESGSDVTDDGNGEPIYSVEAQPQALQRVRGRAVRRR